MLVHDFREDHLRWSCSTSPPKAGRAYAGLLTDEYPPFRLHMAATNQQPCRSSGRAGGRRGRGTMNAVGHERYGQPDSLRGRT
jgi:hypothetical protein